MVQKLRRIEKYFLLMFLSLVTFWRGKAEASYTLCCDDGESEESCCDRVPGHQWEDGKCIPVDCAGGGNQNCYT